MKLSLTAGALFCALIFNTPVKAKSYDTHGFAQAGTSRSTGPRATVHRKHKMVGARRHRVAGAIRRGAGKSLAGVTPVLAAKAREISAACGSVVISAVAGRSNRSNHPRGRAVDMQGNPSCIYSMLKGWPGGYSTDYATAPGGKHVHISYNPGGQEWGVRFVHRHGKSRYAHRHRRYAHAL